MIARDDRGLGRMTIGQATSTFGLTARALRFYEEQGLLEAERDRLGRRLYDPETQDRVAIIARLRSAGVPLHDIRHVLAAPPGETSDAALAALDRRLGAVLAELSAVEDVQATFAGQGFAKKPAALRLLGNRSA